LAVTSLSGAASLVPLTILTCLAFNDCCRFLCFNRTPNLQRLNEVRKTSLAAFLYA